MPTIHNENGFRFVIYFNDHAPAHVHVFKSGETVINLGDVDNAPPSIRENRGMSRQDERQALFITAENQAKFLEKWDEINGD